MKSCEVLLFVVRNLFGKVVESRFFCYAFHRFLVWVRNLFDLLLEFLAPVHARDKLGPFEV